VSTQETKDMTRPRSGEAGFTLVEALVAIVVLAVGLVAVTNLLVVGAASNTIGNHTTNTTTAATEVLERLRNIPFAIGNPPVPQLLVSPAGAIDATPTCNDNVPANNCVSPGNFQAFKDIPGVGRVNTTWEITRIDGQTYFIRVRSETDAPLARRRARAEFTTVRSCTGVSTLGPFAACPLP
jgi:prepilin-type N-terminal cleavage/methylation domain-containing protein